MEVRNLFLKIIQKLFKLKRESQEYQVSRIRSCLPVWYILSQTNKPYFVLEQFNN